MIRNYLQQKRSITLVATMVSSILAAQTSWADVTRALLSIDDQSIPKDEFITAFKIDTWGVGFLAVCHLPPSWEIKSEKYEDPAGLLSGRSDTHGEQLKELRTLFLVDVYQYQPLARGNPNGEYHPATFAGWIETATHVDQPSHRKTLNAGNFRITEAARCPDPPPVQP
jgi:hypothetical protein